MKLLPSLVIILAVLAVGLIVFVFADRTRAVDLTTPRLAPATTFI